MRVPTAPTPSQPPSKKDKKKLKKQKEKAAAAAEAAFVLPPAPDPPAAPAPVPAPAPTMRASISMDTLCPRASHAHWARAGAPCRLLPAPIVARPWAALTRPHHAQPPTTRRRIAPAPIATVTATTMATTMSTTRRFQIRVSRARAVPSVATIRRHTACCRTAITSSASTVSVSGASRAPQMTRASLQATSSAARSVAPSLCSVCGLWTLSLAKRSACGSTRRLLLRSHRHADTSSSPSAPPADRSVRSATTVSTCTSSMDATFASASMRSGCRPE